GWGARGACSRRSRPGPADAAGSRASRPVRRDGARDRRSARRAQRARGPAPPGESRAWTGSRATTRTRARPTRQPAPRRRCPRSSPGGRSRTERARSSCATGCPSRVPTRPGSWRRARPTAQRGGRRAGSVGSRLDDGNHEADRGQDVTDAHALGLGADLDDRPAGVVYLPGQLPAFGFAAADRLLELLHDLLERVAVAVVKDRHPRRRDRFLVDLLDVRLGGSPLDHALDYSPRAPARAPPRARRGWASPRRSGALVVGLDARCGARG